MAEQNSVRTTPLGKDGVVVNVESPAMGDSCGGPSIGGQTPCHVDEPHKVVVDGNPAKAEVVYKRTVYKIPKKQLKTNLNKELEHSSNDEVIVGFSDCEFEGEFQEGPERSLDDVEGVSDSGSQFAMGSLENPKRGIKRKHSSDSESSSDSGSSD